VKARSRELVDKSVAAMISAIEIYNKPDFKYREEAFAILAINSWELLMKAKWLNDNSNRVRSLYVMEKRNKPNGKPYKHLKIKLTDSGNPFTHSLDFVAKKLLEKGVIADAAHRNLRALMEIRDSSVHFYNKSSVFAVRLQEVGSATVKNFVKASQDWFQVDLTKYNFYLMPLAFVAHPRRVQGVALFPGRFHPKHVNRLAKRVKQWRQDARARGVVIAPTKYRRFSNKPRGRGPVPQSCTAHWPEMLQWLEEHPDQTATELLTEFQARYPGSYRRSHLRTLRRRVQVWRREAIQRLIYKLQEHSQDVSETVRA
jgi:hypothetical protein